MHVKRERRRIVTKIREIRKWWDRMKLSPCKPYGKNIARPCKGWNAYDNYFLSSIIYFNETHFVNWIAAIKNKGVQGRMFLDDITLVVWAYIAVKNLLESVLIPTNWWVQRMTLISYPDLLSTKLTQEILGTKLKRTKQLSYSAACVTCTILISYKANYAQRD